MSVVKLTLCFPLYANDNMTHLHIRAQVARLTNELACSFPTVAQADEAGVEEICKGEVKSYIALEIPFFWFY